MEIAGRAKMMGAVVIVGVVAGLGGMGLALLLHAAQRIAFQGAAGLLPDSASFLDRVNATSPERRLEVLVLCGLLAGFGWWGVHWLGKQLVSIADALRSDERRMPAVATIAHALLQIVTVALGSPLGREVAPREIGALVARWIGQAVGLRWEDMRVLIACGAGAGLAAVYNIPLAATLFVLEVLLKTVRPAVILSAMTSAVIGAVIAWIGLGDQAQYTPVHYQISASLVAWSVVAGPGFGLAAFVFAKLGRIACERSPRDARLLLWAIPVFTVLGLAAGPLPGLLGNGKGPTQISFASDMTVQLAAVMFAGKLLFILAALRAGAQGGVLTPGLTLGALMGVILGYGWSVLWPGVPIGAFAIVGAGAFLASSMSMPLTTLALIMEFTGIGHDFLVPLILAIAGSFVTSQACRLARSPQDAVAEQPTVVVEAPASPAL